MYLNSAFESKNPVYNRIEQSQVIKICENTIGICRAFKIGTFYMLAFGWLAFDCLAFDRLIGFWLIGFWRLGFWFIGFWRIGFWFIGFWWLGFWLIGFWRSGKKQGSPILLLASFLFRPGDSPLIFTWPKDIFCLF